MQIIKKIFMWLFFFMISTMILPLNRVLACHPHLSRYPFLSYLLARVPDEDSIKWFSYRIQFVNQKRIFQLGTIFISKFPVQKIINYPQPVYSSSAAAVTWLGANKKRRVRKYLLFVRLTVRRSLAGQQTRQYSDYSLLLHWIKTW